MKKTQVFKSKMKKYILSFPRATNAEWNGT